MTRQIPVFLSSDDNYAPYVATTIASICYNTKHKIKFHVLDGGISSFHKRLICTLKNNFKNFSIEFISINTDHYFTNFPTIKQISLSTYNRFLIPQLINNYNKVIYSDVDVIFLGDISEMYEQDIEQYTIGAIAHAAYINNKQFMNNMHIRLAMNDAHTYFHAGNLLIDCHKWRKENISNKLFDIVKKYNKYLELRDQCALNKCFEGNNYKQLDYRFCLTTQDLLYFADHDESTYKRLRHDVVIRHFETRRKPWLTHLYRTDVPLDHFQDFWFFAPMTPFYAGLQQQFVASVSSADERLPATKNNIKIPDKKMLTSLRAKILGCKSKTVAEA